MDTVNLNKKLTDCMLCVFKANTFQKTQL